MVTVTIKRLISTGSISLKRCVKRECRSTLYKSTRDFHKKASQVDAAIEQKAILKAQLADINEKIEELAQAQALLRYKLDNFDEHLVKFNTKDHDDPTIERLWERN